MVAWPLVLGQNIMGVRKYGRQEVENEEGSGGEV
jgi:hypothetical protein